MKILLDTCAISELRKPSPSPAFLVWFSNCDDRLLYISSITFGELRYGIDILPDGKRKNELLMWYAQLSLSYKGHIITPDFEVYEQWGILRAECKKNGISLSMADGLIAATALSSSMAIVTRNINDFQGLGVEIINPWDD